MAALDTRDDRLPWGVANLAAGALCIPFCYGLSSADFTSFKFLSAALGLGAGLNSVRLFHQHEQGAGVRSAWRASAEMVSGAWIEQIAQSNLPPIYQAPTYQPEFTGVENLQPLPQFQLAAPPETEKPPSPGDGRKMPNLSSYPAVLVYGPSGSGKTTFGQEEVTKRLNLGHEVIVLDPHAAYGAWKGCEIIGGGMNYEAIEQKLQWFFQEVKNRYKRIETEAKPKFKILTMVAEEFTKWSAKVKSATELFWTALTDIRKIGIRILFISHTRTLVATGGAKGGAELRDEGFLEFHLQAEKNEETGEAFPKFQAFVKLPGESLKDRYLVQIERHSDKLTQNAAKVSDAACRSPIEASQPEPEKSGSPDRIPDSGLEAFLAKILNGGGNPTVFGSELGLEHAQKLQLARLVIDRNLGIEKTIFYLWGIKSGGTNHYKYVEARQWLDRLIQEINNQ